MTHGSLWEKGNKAFQTYFMGRKSSAASSSVTWGGGGGGAVRLYAHPSNVPNGASVSDVGTLLLEVGFDVMAKPAAVSPSVDNTRERTE